MELKENTTIVAAVRAGDGERAARLSASHIESGHAALLAALSMPTTRAAA